MKVVIIGGSGRIGKKLVLRLREQNHEVVAASPSSGVNVITGEGLAHALSGAQVVVDVSNSPSSDDTAVYEYFKNSTLHLLKLEASLGINHHVVLSIVGAERLQAGGYFRAKMVQESLVKASSISFTIVRSTQFFEFIDTIAQSATEGRTVRLPPVLMQPIASDDVVSAIIDVIVGKPFNTTIELAGPERFLLDELVRQYLNKMKDERTVTTDVQAGYFGIIPVNNLTLLPGHHPRLGKIYFRDWLSRGA